MKRTVSGRLPSTPSPRNFVAQRHYPSQLFACPQRATRERRGARRATSSSWMRAFPGSRAPDDGGRGFISDSEPVLSQHRVEAAQAGYDLARGRSTQGYGFWRGGDHEDDAGGSPGASSLEEAGENLAAMGRTHHPREPVFDPPEESEIVGMKGNSSCIDTRLPGCGLCMLLAVSLSSLQSLWLAAL